MFIGGCPTSVVDLSISSWVAKPVLKEQKWWPVSLHKAGLCPNAEISNKVLPNECVIMCITIFPQGETPNIS